MPAKVDRVGQVSPGGWRAVVEDGSLGTTTAYLFECVKCGHVKRQTWSSVNQNGCPGCLGTVAERKKIDRTGQVTAGGWRAVVEDSKSGKSAYLFECVKCGHVKRQTWSSADRKACPVCTKADAAALAERLEAEHEMDHLYPGWRNAGAVQ